MSITRVAIVTGAGRPWGMGRQTALPLRPLLLWMLETEPIGSRPKHLVTVKAAIAPRPQQEWLLRSIAIRSNWTD